MSEPKIYKPSIYNGAGIYKTGAEGEGMNVSILMEVETAGVVCQSNGVIF